MVTGATDSRFCSSKPGIFQGAALSLQAIKPASIIVRARATIKVAGYKIIFNVFWITLNCHDVKRLPMGTSVRQPSLMRLFKALLSIKQLPASVQCLLALDAIFCLAYVGTHLIAPDQIIGAKYWDLDDEGGIATWYSTFKLWGIGLVSALFVSRKMAQGRGSAVLLGLPAIFLAMGIDEIARLHERIGKYSDVWLPAGSRANTPFQETGIWVFLVGIPFILFFLWWVYQLRKKLVGYGFEIKIMVTGVFLLLLGALGVELVSNFLYSPAAQTVGILLEEGLEMLGATVIFWAVLKMLNKKPPDKLYKTIQ